MYNFKDCLIDFSKAPDGVKIVDHFDELAHFEEFKKASDLEIKIAICLSDFDSPFLKINDIEHKVQAILEYLEAPAMYNEVINWQNENIIAVTSTYLQMQSKHDYTRWWTLNRLYYELQRELNAPKKNDEDINDYVKRKLLIEKNADDFIEKLQRYEQKLFPDKKMKNAIVVQEMIKILGYPEKHAMNRTAI